MSVKLNIKTKIWYKSSIKHISLKMYLIKLHILLKKVNDFYVIRLFVKAKDIK